METIILVIAAIYFLSHLFAALFARTRIPDVLLLVAIGLVLGPLTGTATLEDFGRVGDVLLTIVLAVILFHGGLQVDLRLHRRAMAPAVGLTVLSFVVTMLVGALIGAMLLDLNLTQALLLGSIIGGTSAAVVIPLARSLRLTGRTFAVLSIEAALTDVLVIVFALGFVEAALLGQFHAAGIILRIATALGAGAVLGALGGILWLWVLNAVRSYPNSGMTTIGFLLLVFGTSEVLGFSGAISAFFFGLATANYHKLLHNKVEWLARRDVSQFNEYEASFLEELVFILKTFFFVYLGLSLTLQSPQVVRAAVTIVGIAYLLRIFIVRAVMPPDTPRREAGIIAVLAPKGLAAAAVAALPLQAGIEGGATIMAAVHAVILASILISTGLIPLLEMTPLGRVLGWTLRKFPEAPN